MNQLQFEIRLAKKSYFYFTLSMFAIYFFTMSLFTSFSKDALLLKQIINNLPEKLQMALGFSQADLSDVHGYMSFVLNYCQLIGSIFAMQMIVQILSQETRSRCGDFLFTRPVKRVQIFFVKWLSVCLLCFFQNVLLFVLYWIALYILNLSSLVSINKFSGLWISTFLLQLFFIGFGSLVATIPKKIKTVLPISVATILFFFIIQTIQQSTNDPVLKYLSPFSYFRPDYFLVHERYYSPFFLITALSCILFTAFALILYQKRDLPNVS